MQTIVLMPDYYCYPLWWRGGEDVGDIDPATLPITKALADELLSWADRFDETLNRGDPAESGFNSTKAYIEFDLRGHQLWHKLRKELDKHPYRVLYQALGASTPLEPTTSSTNESSAIRADRSLFGVAITADKSQFAVLLARIVGEPFVLDAFALQDLGISEEQIINAEASLIANGYLRDKGETPYVTQHLISAVTTSGMKAITQIRSERLKWTQIALHFGKSIVGEALDNTETRLLQPFESVEEAIIWLIELVAADIEDRDLQPTEHQNMESLLSEGKTVASFLLVDTADSQGESGAKTAFMWLTTDQHIWSFDQKNEQLSATQMRKSAICERLITMVHGQMNVH